MTILGIESSCDETGVAVVEDGRRLLSNAVLSQIDLHREFGGIVPEVAARSHLEGIIPTCQKALADAGLDWSQIDGIGVTYGAGLAGSLLIGALTAQTLAIVKDKPLFACNHVEGHVYANFLIESTGLDVCAKPPDFPLLALIVSGKHSQLVLFEDHFNYRLLGQAIDDAIGEAFDKIARLLGLPYPGGPSIAKLALEGNEKAFAFPKARLNNRFDFSFSGLKTAVLRQSQHLAGGDHRLSSLEVADSLPDQARADLAASFQMAAVETVVDKTVIAYEEYRPASVVIAGGVACNLELRRLLNERLPLEMIYAPPSLCTDNGAMIACLACHQVMRSRPPVDPYSLTINPSLSM
ncbi:tRNA (adenosine(37)-N6)-threonylcarbamoyltransferase complex transferase subunit TsaD [Candidatus Saccharibacteria bacterium]|nr:tRNA (adenosine(37)-N6)-threonylcarbamoyltransferase complex transferase subunit TsaD [Candidatus Saccharibacteria bacterium]